MELSRSDYPAFVNALQPNQAVNVLNDRVRRVGVVNNQIADWLQERRRVEELYVQGLKKLAQKQPPDESSELGIFEGPWQKIISATESLAQSHHILSQKIESDVERPLREFATKNREMQAMSNIQGNLAAMAKDIDSAQKKADKVSAKGGKASAGKVAHATSDMENATSQWESQAPFVFEKLQAVDESRLNHLRDVLTQFQTHEVDQVERNRVTAEETLNALLNIETIDEIKTFAARTVSGGSRTERQRSVTSAPRVPTTPGPTHDDSASQRSGTSGSAVKQEKSHDRRTGLSGLKRLGTVMGRRRQSTVYERATSPSKRSAPHLGAFGRSGSSRDIPPIPSPGASAVNLSPSQTEDRTGALDSISPTTERPVDHDPDRIEPAPLPSYAQPPIQQPSTNGGHGLDDVAQLQMPGSDSSVPGMNFERKDSEGFSVPPSAIDAISQAEKEAADENSQPQFKLDIRNAPIQEEDADADAALANVANALRAQAAPNRKTGTGRGRRDVRNTVFVPSDPAPPTNENIPISPQSPLKLGRAATLSSEDHMSSDTQSIHSSRSLSSMVSTSVKHPEMHEQGLNSSVVETISAWFENGQATKAVVIGELALVYNPNDLSKPFGAENIRLENFPVLEKVAPNPTFIQQIHDKPGEYSVDLSQITRTAVAFKYQVHLEDSNLSIHAPILLTPSWKIEPTRASAILHYALNPAFAEALKSKSVVLQNLVIILHLEGARATSCQSKPAGSFARERSLVYWRLGDVTLDTETPQRLLARFITDSEAKPGNAEARWEINGEHAAGLGSGLSVSQAVTFGDQPGTSADSDPFADETSPTTPTMAWKEVSTVRRLQSGHYQSI